MSAKFSLIKKGYDPAEVDAYIETLENVIRSYKDKDKAIKNAILSAQVAADNIVVEAKEHADEVVANSLAFLNEIRESIAEQRRLIDGFQSDYNLLMRRYIVDANNKDFETIRGKLAVLENYYVKLSKEKEPIIQSKDTGKTNVPEYTEE